MPGGVRRKSSLLETLTEAEPRLLNKIDPRWDSSSKSLFWNQALESATSTQQSDLSQRLRQRHKSVKTTKTRTHCVMIGPTHENDPHIRVVQRKRRRGTCPGRVEADSGRTATKSRHPTTGSCAKKPTGRVLNTRGATKYRHETTERERINR